MLSQPATHLLDDSQFAQALAQATSLEKKHALFRQQLQSLDERLAEAFHHKAPIEDLVTGRAFAIDQLLLHAWSLFLEPDSPHVALVAVGGYGRGELHPKSDIDFMVLLDNKAAKQFHDAIRRFVVFLYDIKLDIGYSVRTLKECVSESKADITIATNLMEARLLTGNRSLFEQMRTQTSTKKIWPSARFFKAKWEEQQARHHKFHDTAYNLEPNIKEGPGGLRDIQMIGWVAKRHFNATTLHDLVTHDFLTQDELGELLKGQAFLWQVRFALHLVTGRREDRLLFDYQKELARLFGFKDTHIIAVEQFMQKYYQTVMRLERLNEMLLQHYQEAILLNKKSRRPRPITPCFQSNRGFIEVTHDAVFTRTPTALLEIFLVLQTHPKLKGVRASTIRLIRSHLHLIDEDFRRNPQARKLFIEILRQPHGLTHELRRMNRYGVLAAYLPEFGNIVGRMQYDMFHTYTVDEHTLFVVRNLRRFTVPEFHKEFPFCSDLIRSLSKPELLYISGLYHDIAKGRQGDHSRLGAVDARRFCLDHGLSEYDADFVAWLVEHHLLMSTTAQRKDISDPEVVNEFAQIVGDKSHLDFLYLLTVADIRGTNPNLWNSWKASLLEELYHATNTLLQRGMNRADIQKERLHDRKTAALKLLHKAGISTAQAEQVWSTLNDGYFLRYHPEEIFSHTRSILQTTEEDLPLVLIENHVLRGSTSIFIYTRDHDYLFGDIAAKLEQLNLNILDARIITAKNGYALNTYLVHEYTGQNLQDEARIAAIIKALREHLLQPEPVKPLHLNIRPPRQIRFLYKPTRILFEKDKSGRRTILKLSAIDRPGLLSVIGTAFRRYHIRLQNARIATFGEMAEDTFIITGIDNRPLTETEQQALEKTIRELLDPEPADAPSS